MDSKIEKMFGTYLCSDDVLAKHMPSKVFDNYLKIKEKGEPLDVETAKFIAKAIKSWANENGVTHYSHWFAPFTGKTAEKQVSFLEIDNKGNFIEDFNEKALIKGETDASSFPNGGERMTFEARGYTVWDYTSPAFIKEDNYGNKVIYIPTAFCAYTGTALDEKTPLLRASESLNNNAVRILKHLGYDDVKRVICNVGAEQEYFLIKTEDYKKRLDLKFTGRTLLGEKPLMSQEVCSHYFGIIKDDISNFMNEVDHNLWKMGISAKLQHNEVAPSQYELVPIFSSVNTASDQNQIIMEIIERIAEKHGYTALFHEKPFASINGSGKHINISLSTDTGINLLDSNIKDNTLFLTFFTSIITAIDRYYKLIRCSSAYYENDFRLGGDEAPPTLISVFIGEKFEEILNSIGEEVADKKQLENILDTRVKSLPKMLKDYCDRNRTSPFAYSGNKFEFRMVGSSQSIAWPSTCICTILSKVLKEIADKLDEISGDKKLELINILKDNIVAHKRIIFNGNGYDDEWKKQAQKRGLVEYRDSLSCYEILKDDDVLDVFKSTGVLDKIELDMRRSTLVKNYTDTAKVEAKTLAEMINKQIIPSLNKYITDIANSVKIYKSNSKTDGRKKLLKKLDFAMNSLFVETDNLAEILKQINNTTDIENAAKITKQKLVTKMSEIRKIYDDIENILPDYIKPFPTYNNILF